MLDQHFLYFPTRELIGSPADYGIAFEDVYFETADGHAAARVVRARDGRRHAALAPRQRRQHRHRLPDIDLFHRELGVNILIYDYRGFGRSSADTPSEEGLYHDADAALRHLQSREDVDPAKIVYFGRSLGVAIATELAVRHRPYGLILESGFPSIEYMANVDRPWLPAFVSPPHHRSPLRQRKQDRQPKRARAHSARRRRRHSTPPRRPSPLRRRA